MPGKLTEGVDEETKPKGTVPQDPKPDDQPQDPKDGEEDNSQDPNEGEGTSEETGAKPTENVNVHKLERDLANREKRIKELEAELTESKKLMASSDERISAIEQQLKDAADAKTKAEAESALTSAGCIDLELGRMALDALDGDVEKLKETKPFLFKSEDAPKNINTSGKPAGSSSGGVAMNIREGLKGR
ncbi:hypothetical protein [Lancefieldella sp. Marseille-Q7238]|uniref:hypothetical protein n=1 Tax=Lancefieldella sp. Marseille-Q7238 TaxID=3022127 RepID=UPI0024A890D5|nr:hypothetical protein [Lancefieldella sp. Marseille-Q7238]